MLSRPQGCQSFWPKPKARRPRVCRRGMPTESLADPELGRSVRRCDLGPLGIPWSWERLSSLSTSCSTTPGLAPKWHCGRDWPKTHAGFGLEAHIPQSTLSKISPTSFSIGGDDSNAGGGTRLPEGAKKPSSIACHAKSCKAERGGQPEAEIEIRLLCQCSFFAKKVSGKKRREGLQFLENLVYCFRACK